MAVRNRYSSSVIYKFLINKIGKLVKTSHGRLKYASNFDNIIYDIFGVKHFVKRINESYDSRDIIDVLETVGSDYLMAIMNDSKLYEAMHDLIAINYRINELRKEIRKQAKRDKRNKSDVKEYNYLSNLYKESIKYFRKKLGIKNAKTSYKRRYKSLNDVINRSNYDYDDDFVSIFMSDDDAYFEDDDYDDDYESTSELDDFVNRMNGTGRYSINNRDRSRTRNRNQRSDSRRYNRDVLDFELDDEDDDDYDYDIDERSNQRRSAKYSVPSLEDDNRISEQLNELTDTVNDLSSAVQTLMMKDEYVTNQRRRQQYQDPINVDSLRLKPQSNTPSTLEEVRILTDFVGKLSDDQIKLKNDQKTIAKALDEITQTQGKIFQFLNDLFEDDEEDYADVVMADPVMHKNNEIMEQVNRFEDAYEYGADTVDTTDGVSHMSKEQLIDAINKSDVQVSETVKESVETKTTVSQNGK